MFSTDDTIVAIATPSGRGGIGVIRLSGPAASDVARKLLHLGAPLTPRHATFARTQRDHVIATLFVAPHSYTGEDVVEIAAHGSPVVLRQVVSQAISLGARLAEPGEFTLRAFLNGRIDLVQAEAVADLIDAATPLQARAAFDQLDGTLTGRIAEIDAELFDLTAKLEASLDFPDEGYHFVEPGETSAALRTVEGKINDLLLEARRGRLIREGARVAIVGKPNVGKSSLFNMLVGAGRAIVTPVPGTTRDLVSETADVEGLRLVLVDTAGVHETADAIESEGIARARAAWTTSDLVVVVLDSSRPLDSDDTRLLEETCASTHVIVANKSDLPAAWDSAAAIGVTTSVSSKTGAGFETFRREMRTALEGANPATARDSAAVTNVRHMALLERAHLALKRASESVESAGGPVPEEFVLTDIQDARAALEEVTGKRTSEDLLRHIFSRFCIGK